MKKFRFTFQTVHNLREARRDQEERALAQASTAAREAAATLEETKITQARATEAFAAALQPGEIDPFSAALSVDYLAALARRRNRDQGTLETLERAQEAQRVVTAEAAKAAEATARLRQSQHEIHRQEVLRAEQIALDELAVLGHVRKKAART